MDILGDIYGITDEHAAMPVPDRHTDDDGQTEPEEDNR